MKGSQARKIELQGYEQGTHAGLKDRACIVVSGSASDRLFDLDRLFSLMIHQIRNHCMSVKGYASLLSYQDEVDEDARKWITKINMGLSSLEEFLTGFENYRLSRMPSASRIDVGFIVRSALQMLPKESIERIHLDVDIPEGAEIIGDANDIRKMVYHAVRNAVEAIPNSGTVEISFNGSAGEPGWVIEIRDDGIGMSQQQVEKALEILYTTKQGHIGCGLNLMVAAARRVGASVEIDSTKGKGTVIRFKKI